MTQIEKPRQTGLRGPAITRGDQQPLDGIVFQLFCKMWGKAHILQKTEYSILDGIPCS